MGEGDVLVAIPPVAVVRLAIYSCGCTCGLVMRTQDPPPQCKRLRTHRQRDYSMIMLG
jgi:hypothetical protein